MCLLTVKTPEQKWNVEDLKESLYSNPDGFGFAGITSDGKIRIAKGFTEAELAATLPLFQDLHSMFHSRYATHGSKDTSQLHPYRIADKLYMAHNGIFDIPTPDKTKSDTWHMARRLASVGINSIMAMISNDDAFKEFETNIGGNKVAFIHPEMGIKIANKHLGHEGPGGAWYSNNTYKPYTFAGSNLSNYNWKSFGNPNCASEMLENWLTDIDHYLLETILDDIMTEPEMAAQAIVKFIRKQRKSSAGTKLRELYETEAAIS